MSCAEGLRETRGGKGTGGRDKRRMGRGRGGGEKRGRMEEKKDSRGVGQRGDGGKE